LKSNKIFIFLGPPGSGKGTLSAMCMEQFGWLLLSTGNLCRDHIARNTDLGKEIKKFSDQGLLVPDEIIAQMVADWLLSHKNLPEGIIFDGYPRTLEQAEALYNLLQTKLQNFCVVLVKVNADDQLLENRILGRVVCPKKDCGRTYSTTGALELRPKKTMVCDSCESMLICRTDDTKESLQLRLKIYYQHEQSIIDFYVGKGFDICMLNGAQSKQEVFKDFTNLTLNNHGC